MNIENDISEGKIKQRIVDALYNDEAKRSKSASSNQGVCMKDNESHDAAEQNASAATTLKQFLKRVPVLSNILIWLNRFRKMPWRALRTEEEVRSLRAELAVLGEKIDEGVRGMRAEIAVLSEKNNVLQARLGSIDARTEASSVLINDKLPQIRPPVISAGENLLATRVDGFIMGIPAEDVRLSAALVFETLEPGLRQLLKNTIREGMIVADVGAHIGLVSLIAARMVGKSGKVHCFEPTPRTYRILKNNISMNNLDACTELRQMAIADRAGKARLALREIFGNNTMFPSQEDSNFVEIETDSLDHYFGNAPKVDLVKIDAEGAEPFVLRGMRKIIEHNPSLTVFLEFAPSHLSRAGIGAVEFIKEIRSYGFTIRQVEEPSGAVTPISDDDLVNAFSVNLILRLESAPPVVPNTSL